MSGEVYVMLRLLWLHAKNVGRAKNVGGTKMYIDVCVGSVNIILCPHRIKISDIIGHVMDRLWIQGCVK